MKIFIYLVFLFLVSSLSAQKFTLEGYVKDKDAITLEGATVYLQSIKDSVPMAYGITNKEGQFSIQVNTDEDSKAIFNIAYLGYKPYRKTIDVPEGKLLDLGNITLEDQVEQLNVVSVIGKAPPVVIKKDTVEYNADSFKTMPNDKAEDLLKKLPGIEIDMDGGITFNGVDVEAINVDGMRFFGEKNGNIALKNIPSNAISKVQVTDYKTEMQKFTGEESDSGTKEINLKIKKGKNRAYFGDVNLGYGTDEKYQGNANLFQLVDGKQLGVIAGTNNINMSRGFNALPDAESSVGYIESDFVGANFSKGKWNETRVNANYTYSAQNNDTEQRSTTENFLPNFNYITKANNKGFNDSDKHRAGSDLKFIIKPENKQSNSWLQLSNETNFDASNNTSYSTRNSTSEYSNGDLVSEYVSENESNNSSYNFNNEFRVTGRLPQRGGFATAGITTNFDKSDGDSYRYSKNEILKGNRVVVQDQISTSNNMGSRIGFNARLHKPLFKNFTLIPRYDVYIDTRNNENLYYDLDENTDLYEDFNEQISSDSKYISTTVRPSLRLRYEYKDFRFEVEGAYVNTFRKYDDNIIQERDFKNAFEYVNYSGRIRYRDPNGYKNISLDYRQNVNLPSVTQLQPVEDVSNITHIKVGNPFLQPEINHGFDFRYQNNLAFHNINIGGRANVSIINDKIISSTITDEDLIRYTTYENINGNYNLSGNASVSKSYFSKNSNFNLSLRISGNYANNNSIQNAIEFNTQTSRLTPTGSVQYSYDKKIEVSASYSYSMVNTNYNTDMFNDNDYFIQNLRFDSSVFFLKDFFLSNKVSYRYNSRVGDDFDGAAIFWNAGLGVQLWDNKATLTAVGYDVLGKNNGFNRSVTETLIRDVENKILEQYFMLTFVYKFGQFAGQNMNAGDRGFRGRGSGGRGRGR